MSVASRQFQEMVNVAYQQLQQEPVKTRCDVNTFDADIAESHGFKCPCCGGELVGRGFAGKVVYYVHKAGG